MSDHVHVAPALNAAFRVGMDRLLPLSLAFKDLVLRAPPILNENWLVNVAEVESVMIHASFWVQKPRVRGISLPKSQLTLCWQYAAH